MASKCPEEQPKKRPRLQKKNKCLLPILKEGIFLDEVLGFLEKEDILTLFQTDEITRLFRLELHYCVVHGGKLDPLEAIPKASAKGGKGKNEEDETVEEAKEEEESNSSVSTEGRWWNNDDPDDDPDEFSPHSLRRWKEEHPFENPNRCYPCSMALKNLELCSKCEKYVDWDDFVHCRGCGYSACEECNAVCKTIDCGYIFNIREGVWRGDDQDRMCTVCTQSFKCRRCHQRFCDKNQLPPPERAGGGEPDLCFNCFCQGGDNTWGGIFEDSD